MTPCIAQATTLTSSFVEDIDAYAAAGWPAVELWLTKVESHLQTGATVAETRQRLADANVAPAAAAYQGGLLLSEGEARQAHFDHFRRRLDLCQALGVPVLSVVADFARRIDGPSLGRAVASLGEASQWAAGYGVRLALEFRADTAFCTNLDTALTLVEQCGEPNLGVCLDAFHFHKGPSKPEDLERLSAANVFLVQVSDVAGVPRELAGDSDRVLPGEGDIRLAPLVDRLRAIGYAGAVSLELFNPVLWQTKAATVAEMGLAAVRRLLGPAEVHP